jgi:hypothetical protein
MLKVQESFPGAGGTVIVPSVAVELAGHAASTSSGSPVRVRAVTCRKGRKRSSVWVLKRRLGKDISMLKTWRWERHAQQWCRWLLMLLFDISLNKPAKFLGYQRKHTHSLACSMIPSKSA